MIHLPPLCPQGGLLWRWSTSSELTLASVSHCPVNVNHRCRMLMQRPLAALKLDFRGFGTYSESLLKREER